MMGSDEEMREGLIEEGKAYLSGYLAGYDRALDDIIEELEKIDSCGFGTFSFCLIKEIAKKMKKGKGNGSKKS